MTHTNYNNLLEILTFFQFFLYYILPRNIFVTYKKNYFYLNLVFKLVYHHRLNYKYYHTMFRRTET